MGSYYFNPHVAYMSVISAGILILGVVILIKSKINSSKLFSLDIILTSIWSVLMVITQAGINDEINTILTKLIYFIGGLIAVIFYFFSTTYINNNINKKFLVVILVTEIILFPVYLNTDLIIGKFHSLNDEGYMWQYGKFWYIFILNFIFFWLLGLYKLLEKYYSLKGTSESIKIRNIIISILFGFIPPTIISVIFPLIGYYEQDWLSIIFSPIWILIIGYNIVKHELLNVIVTVQEIIIYSVWLMSLYLLFLVKSNDELSIIVILLFIILTLSVLLIRSNMNQKSQMKHIETLSKQSTVSKASN